MNTDIKTIVNILVQQLNGSVCSSTKHAPQNAQTSSSEIRAPNIETDNNRHIAQKDPKVLSKLKFEDRLREKINNVPETIHNSITKKDKTLDTSCTEIECQNTYIQALFVENEQNSEPVKTEIEYPTDIIDACISQELPAIPSLLSMPPVTFDSDSDTDISTCEMEMPKSVEIQPSDIADCAPIVVSNITPVAIPDTSSIAAPDVNPLADADSVSIDTSPIIVSDSDTAIDTSTSSDSANPDLLHLEIAKSVSAPSSKTTFEDGIMTSSMEHLDIPYKPIAFNRDVFSEKVLNPLSDNVLHDFVQDASQPSSQLILPFAKPKMPLSDINTAVQFQEIKSQADSSPAELHVQKINVAADQTYIFQPQKQKNATKNVPFDIISETDEKLIAYPTNDPFFGENTSSSLAAFKNMENTFLASGPGRQIQDVLINAHRPGAHQIIIRLAPPDLGRVTIKFIENPNGIIGTLYVDKSQTKDQIQQVLPGIIQNLQKSDIQIKKLEVVLNNQQNNTANEHASNYNGGFSHQNSSGQSYVFTNTLSWNDWLAKNGELNMSDDTPMVLTDKSINILV